MSGWASESCGVGCTVAPAVSNFMRDKTEHLLKALPPLLHHRLGSASNLQGQDHQVLHIMRISIDKMMKINKEGCIKDTFYDLNASFLSFFFIPVHICGVYGTMQNDLMVRCRKSLENRRKIDGT